MIYIGSIEKGQNTTRFLIGKRKTSINVYEQIFYKGKLENTNITKGFKNNREAKNFIRDKISKMTGK